MDEFEVVVVGGGPGGYVAAIRAAQLKLKTALIERDAIGGICLNWGCIPSKALLRNAEILELLHRANEFGFKIDLLSADLGAAVTRSRDIVTRMVKGVEYLLRKNGVEVFRGEGYVAGASEIEVRPDGRHLRAHHIILATGARTRQLPGLPIDGERVMTSREALGLRQTPRSIVIIGGGPVGCEFAYVSRGYGAEVTIVEQFPRLLPLEDEEISTIVERAFNKQGMTLRTGSQVVEITHEEGGVGVVVDHAGERETIRAERVLVGIGVEGNTDNLGLESVGVRTDRGFIPVDAQMATNIAGIYAVGDVTGPPLLAHVASAQGINAVEGIAGLFPAPLDYEQMPRATYCQPEVCSLGLTEVQARERYKEVSVGHFPFRANGRALALGEPEGLAKIVADRRSGRILGVHLVGPGVTELLGEASLGQALEATVSQIGLSVHAHPTLSEVVKEAALSAMGEAIHVWQDR